MSKTEGTKNRALPTDANKWDAKTKLRFVARFEHLISQVPPAARLSVFALLEESMNVAQALAAPQGALFASDDVAGALE